MQLPARESPPNGVSQGDTQPCVARNSDQCLYVVKKKDLCFLCALLIHFIKKAYMMELFILFFLSFTC